MTDTSDNVKDACPECSAPGRVVTVVTLRAMGGTPRRVIVTRQCTAGGCHNKYPVVKPETELTEQERALWHQP